MSSRQLRKLQQQRELEQAKLQAQREEEAEEEENDFTGQPASKASLFANLALLEDEGGHDDESDDEPQMPEPEAPVVAPKKSKKSKKKKKKAKSPKPEVTEEDASAEDEIEKALEQLNLKNGPLASYRVDEHVNPELERLSRLLSINNQHLKVANEMRNLFGKAALENHDDAGGPIPRSARRRQRGAMQQVDLETALKGHHLPGKGLPELTLRRNLFIQGKDDWPRATTGGLTMAVKDDLRAQDGTVEFRFVHDKAYNDVSQQFAMFVEMGDPQNLIGLLQRNPYHISLLLQVSKIAKNQTDHALASDLVERALFTFGRASLSLFGTQLAAGKARLDFARPENREFWLAAYHYIQSLMMKGTYRTALEWAKVMWSLDAEDDPYCALLMIHHFALRAQDYQYVLDTYDSDTIREITSFVSHASPSLALAAMHLREGALARRYLESSIRTVPWTYCRLFQELNLDTPPPSIWGSKARTTAEELFCEIYVSQTKDLWNTPEATSLLMEVTHAMSKVEVESIAPTEDSAITLDIARHVYLEQNRAVMSLVPSALLHRLPNSDSDPLPPDTNIFSWPNQANAFASAQQQQAGAGGFADGFWDPIAAMRRLVPGMSVEEIMEYFRRQEVTEELVEGDEERRVPGGWDEESETEHEHRH